MLLAIIVVVMCAVFYAVLRRLRIAHEARVTAIASVTATERDRKLAPFHIQRFTAAIEQCEKGPERMAELERNLRYWQAVQAAEELRS
jgi:hypothetical protein